MKTFRRGPESRYVETFRCTADVETLHFDPDVETLLNVSTLGERFNVAADHPDVLKGIAKAVATHKASITPVENQLTKR